MNFNADLLCRTYLPSIFKLLQLPLICSLNLHIHPNLLKCIEKNRTYIKSETKEPFNTHLWEALAQCWKCLLVILSDGSLSDYSSAPGETTTKESAPWGDIFLECCCRGSVMCCPRAFVWFEGPFAYCLLLCNQRDRSLTGTPNREANGQSPRVTKHAASRGCLCPSVCFFLTLLFSTNLIIIPDSFSKR